MCEWKTNDHDTKRKSRYMFDDISWMKLIFYDSPILEATIESGMGKLTGDGYTDFTSNVHIQCLGRNQRLLWWFTTRSLLSKHTRLCISSREWVQQGRHSPYKGHLRLEYQYLWKHIKGYHGNRKDLPMANCLGDIKLHWKALGSEIIYT